MAIGNCPNLTNHQYFVHFITSVLSSVTEYNIELVSWLDFLFIRHLNSTQLSDDRLNRSTWLRPFSQLDSTLSLNNRLSRSTRLTLGS